MKNTARTLAATFALTLGALSAAHAGHFSINENNYPPEVASAPSTLTREAVIADLVAARAKNPLLGTEAGYNNPPEFNTSGTLPREAVIADLAAARAKNPLLGTEADSNNPAEFAVGNTQFARKQGNKGASEVAGHHATSNKL